MNKFKIRFFTLALAIFSLIAVILAIAFTEQSKRIEKYIADKKYYDDQFNSWSNYQSEYKKQVEELRAENQKQMAETKANYEKLLAQQPELIKQNTVTQQVNTPTTTKKTVKVSKPSSSSSTRSS